MAQYEYVEGHTEPINQKLWSVDPITGVQSVMDLTGMTVELRLYARGQTTKKTLSGSQYGITTAATGEVYFNPAAGDLLYSEGPLKARWWVTDSGGKLAPFPDQEADIWIIRKP